MTVIGIDSSAGPDRTAIVVIGDAAWAAAEADAIADLVNLVTIRRLDPERFHQQRDEIAKRLRALASRLRGNVRRQPSTTWRSPQHARAA